MVVCRGDGLAMLVVAGIVIRMVVPAVVTSRDGRCSPLVRVDLRFMRGMPATAKYCMAHYRKRRQNAEDQFHE